MKHKKKKLFSQRSISLLMIIILLFVNLSSSIPVFAAGSSTPVSAPVIAPSTSIAPANLLIISEEGIQGSGIEILETGSGVNEVVRLSTSSPVVGGALFRGDWTRAGVERIPEFDGYEAISVQFTGSDPNAINYRTDPEAGWRNEDLSLYTTTMWLKVKYKNAGYYNGQLIDAVATIKITPHKNRTPETAGTVPDYSDKSYFPIIQLSEILSKGWAWQNVNEFNFDVEFYEKGSLSAISFPDTSINDIEGVYYTINSLNPAKIFSDGHTVGPEYVLPKDGSISEVYVIENSNIKTEYSGGINSGIQYAYNGGTNPWGPPWDDNDVPGSAGWNLNSVMFMAANISHIDITLGHLQRDPVTDHRYPQEVNRTTFMWSSFSVKSFDGYEPTYKDIPISKIWIDDNETYLDYSLEVDLYRQWTTGDWSESSLISEEKIRSIGLDNSNNWENSFINIISEEDVALKLGLMANQVRYVVKESPVEGYTPSYTYNEDGSIVITNTKNVAAIDVTKTADKETYSKVGDVIAYTVKATNTGNITLHNVSITDDKIGLKNIAYTVKAADGTVLQANAVNGESTLNPGDYLEMTSSYTITQKDMDNGSILNTAKGKGTPEDPANPGQPDPNAPTVEDEDEVTVPGEQTPAIDLVKKADKDTLVAGEKITYTLTVTNTGNVTLTNVVVADPLAGLSAMTYKTVDGLAVAEGTNITLAPGQVLVAEATYAVTQNDVNRGTLENTATTTGTDPKGTEVTDKDTVILPSVRTPAIDVTKTADKETYSKVGDVIAYTVKATNTGNITLHNVSITDDKIGLKNIAYTVKAADGTVLQANAVNGESTLNPGDYLEMTSSYTITQKDMDNGSILNTAKGKGTPEDPANPGQPDPNAPTVEDEAKVVIPAKSIPKPNNPEPDTEDSDNGMPKTGDNQAAVLAKLGLLLFSIALMALTVADFTLRKKYFRPRKQKY